MNNEVVGMGFSNKAYEHQKPLTIADMVLGETYKLINPKMPSERNFYEFKAETSRSDKCGYFLRDGQPISYLIEYADMEPAPRTVHINGIECVVSKLMYEELMMILETPPAA